LKLDGDLKDLFNDPKMLGKWEGEEEGDERVGE